MKNIIFFFVFIFLSACATSNISIVKEKTLSQNELKDLNTTKEWWKLYDDKKLDEFIFFVLENNTDIKVAKTNFLMALSRADLINYDLYPTLSASLGFSSSRNLNQGIHSNNFSNSLNLNYELDIYSKISDEVNAREFDARASAYDLESLKLSIINSTINNIFELAYFNDVSILLKEYILNLEQMKNLYNFKYELGKIENLDLLNIDQSLLKAKQNLLSNEQNKELLLKNLKDLIGKQEGFAYLEYFKNLSLKDFKNLNVNFNIPLDALFYRPDVLAKLNNLKAAFKDYSSVKKSMFPAISLGAGFSGSDAKFDDSFKFSFLDGNIKISLPFLDYARLKKNIKISEYSYEILVFEYEQVLQSAINEFVYYSKNYENTIKILNNLEKINLKQEQITKAYLQKYELGKSELKDYLDAKNSLNSSLQEYLRAKFNLLSVINTYYQIITIYYDDINEQH
ncbi:TolC family protein [Campylobacter sp. TTU-622]|uniref:TolC family protein n=1 Tax=unclassified Campylobacter TaxID=2593542 RepID=UPI001907F787|nr:MULTISPECIES: TolC family protein [unclassified Campylobacter]MBK1972011.1 TolC family protein [Campylobacter sp. TTU_617]MBK1973740.1 TolC family protein [Campylobacter sp. TTU-622]